MSDESMAGCLLAREAITRIDEMGAEIRALDRRLEVSRSDRVRLGERITDVSERLADHESASNESVKQLDATLRGLSNTVHSLDEVVRAIAIAPTTSAGLALSESWRATGPAAKMKITGAIVAILSAPELLKALVGVLVRAVSHFIGK